MLGNILAQGGNAVTLWLQAVSVYIANFVTALLTGSAAFSPQVFYFVTVKAAAHDNVVMDSHRGFAVFINLIFRYHHVLMGW
jgi:hypothetical protein